MPARWRVIGASSFAGHPTIVVRNMPGAGGARSAAYVSTVAPKDGTVLAAPMPGAIVGPLLDDKSQAGFDPVKLQYIGTADSGVRVCVTMDRSKVKTAADALTTKAIMGATRPAARRAITPTCIATRRAPSSMSCRAIRA